MLKSINLEKFRLHKNLKIVFDPYITTLVGKSYAGKSTVINALKWVNLNKPTGTSIIPWGAKQAKVSIKLDTHKITRIRGKGKNLYLLTENVRGAITKHKFKAFGNNIPEKITNITNITENNFQGQHSLPFWFGETSGEVARKLNSIVNLSLIDTSLSYLSSTLTKARHTVDICKDRLEEIRKRKKELVFIVEMEKEWNRVKKASKQYTALDVKTVELENILESCEEHAETIKSIKPPSLSSLTQAYEALFKMEDEYTKIEIMMDKIEGMNDKLCTLQNMKANIDKELKILTKNRCPLCGRKNMTKPIKR